MKKIQDQYLSEENAARLLELPLVTIQRWIQQGKIPYKIFNDKTVLLKAEIISWAKSHDLNLKQKTNDIVISRKSFSLGKAIELGGIYNNIIGKDIPTVFKNSLKHLSFIENKQKEIILDELLSREELASTGLGNGIAIPHSRNRTPLNIDCLHIPVFFLEEPIIFNAVDNKPVFVFFMIFSTNLQEHLKTLSKLSFIIKQQEIFNIIIEKNTNTNLLNQIKIIENENS